MKLPIILAFFAFATAPANAVTFILKADGVLASGIDGAGMFLPSGASLVGQPFTIRLFIDTNRGTISQSDSIFTISGSDDGDDSPVYRLLLDVGNSKINDRIVYYSYYSTSEDTKTSVNSSIIDRRGFGDNLARLGIIDLSASDLPNDSVGFPFNNGPNSFIPVTTANAVNFNYRIIDSNGQQVNQTVAHGYMSNISVSMVPDGSTWVLMIMGFGAIGAIVRIDRAKRRYLPKFGPSKAHRAKS